MWIRKRFYSSHKPILTIFFELNYSILKCVDKYLIDDLIALLGAFSKMLFLKPRGLNWWLSSHNR